MTIEQIFDITVYDPQATWREVTSWLPSQQTFNIRYIESLDQFDQQQLTLVRLSAIDHLIPLTNGDAPNLIACIEKGEFAFAIEAMNKKQLYSYVLVEEVKALLSPIARAFYRPKSDYLTTIKQVLFQTSSTPDSPGTKIRVTKLLHQMFNYQLAAVRLVDGFNNLNLFTEAVFGLKRSPEAQRSIALTNSPVLQNVVRTRDYWQTIDVQYYSSEDQLIQLAKSEGVRGLVIVPLVLRKDVLGVLIVGSGFPYLPSAEELVLLECLAEIASLDHNNYRNFQMLKLLETINRRLVTMESLEQTIQEIPEHAINVSQAQRMAFGFYLAAKTQYVPEWSKSKNIDEAQLTWAEKDSAWVQLAEYVRDVRANPKGELLIPNIETPTLELTRIIERLRPFFEHHGIKALVGMRLQPSIRGNAANGAHHSQQLPDALGVLFVFYQSAHPYALDGEQHEDKRPLNIYCDQLAATLHRTHQILRTDRERKMLQEFAKATNSSSPRHATDTQIWHTILNDLMDHTGAQSACMGIKQKNERWQYYREGVDIDLAKQWVKYTEQVEKGYELEDVYRNRLLTPIRKTDSNEFVGAICLFSAEHHRFDDYDGEECANLAVYIGIESQIGMLFDNQEEQKKQLEALTISSHQLTLIRPIRHDIENELKRLRRYIHYDLIILHPYSPYWEQFNSEIISLRQPSYQQYVRWDINSLLRAVEKIRSAATEEIDLSDVYSSTNGSRAIQERKGIILRDSKQRPFALLSLINFEPRTLSAENNQEIHQTRKKISALIEKSYIFSRIVEQLQQSLNFDIVRLHVHRAESNMWSIPDTAGELYRPNYDLSRWPKSGNDLVGPINNAVINNPNGEDFFDQIPPDSILNGSFAEREQIKSMGYVVLKSNNNEIQEGGPSEVLGILFVGHRTPIPWTEGLKFTVRLFANHAAAAIQNRRRLRRLKEDGIRAQTVKRTLEQLLQQHTSRTDAWSTLLAEALSITQAEFGFIAQCNGYELTIKAVISTQGAAYEQQWIKQYDQVVIDANSMVGKAIDAGKRRYQQVAEPSDLFLLGSQDEMMTPRTAMVAILRNESYDSMGVLFVRHSNNNQEHDDKLRLKNLISLTEVASLVPYLYRNNHKQNNAVLVNAWVSLIRSAWWKDVLDNIWALQLRLDMAKSSLDPDLFNAATAEYKAVYMVQKQIEESFRIIQALDKTDPLQLFPTISQQPIDIFALHENLRRIIQEAIQDKDVTCEPLMPSSQEIEINQSLELFESAIRILLENAIKAMQDSEEKKLTVTTQKKRNQVWIDITDTGKGLDAKARVRFFQIPFDKDPENGSGTGVLMARHIFRLLRGDALLIRSSVGEGTTVRVKLPIQSDSRKYYQ